MGFAAAVSQHPLTAQATGEVAGALLDAAGPRPDLVTLFTTTAHAGALEDMAGAVEAAVQPIALVGAAAESVIGPNRELERGPAVVALAGPVGPLRPVALSLTAEPDGSARVQGWPETVPFDVRTLVLFGDPFSFPTDRFLRWMACHHPGITVIGGMAAGPRGPGGSRLVGAGTVRTDGAVGVLLGPSVKVTGAVSQGCRPLGRPLVVTGATGNVVTELAGRSPLERLLHLAATELGPGAVERLGTGGLRIGRVTDETTDHPGRDDFLVRAVIGVDRASGAMAVGDEIPVGTTVQFQVVDPDGAGADLRRVLAGTPADAALLFAGSGRGTRLFARPDHDVGAVRAALGPVPTAGFFTAAELCPVRGVNARHTMAAAVAVLHAPTG